METFHGRRHCPLTMLPKPLSAARVPGIPKGAVMADQREPSCGACAVISRRSEKTFHTLTISREIYYWEMRNLTHWPQFPHNADRPYKQLRGKLE